MSDFASMTEELKREQGNLKVLFDRLAQQIEHLRSEFFLIERKCFSDNIEQCISVHDTFKLEIAQIQRLGDREKMLCFEQCTPIIPQQMVPRDVNNWEISSQKEYEIFNEYFSCYKPFMQRYIHYMRQEKEVFERANEKLTNILQSNI